MPEGASLLLGPIFGGVIARIASLKVVEYSGPKSSTTCYSSNDTRVKVQIYKLYKTGEESEDLILQQAEITPMPHTNFDGRWDE